MKKKESQHRIGTYFKKKTIFEKNTSNRIIITTFQWITFQTFLMFSCLGKHFESSLFQNLGILKALVRLKISVLNCAVILHTNQNILQHVFHQSKKKTINNRAAIQNRCVYNLN